MPIHHAVASAVGPRPRNEDRAISVQFSMPDLDATLLVVCDGMGGAARGDVAATAASHSIALNVARYAVKFACVASELLVDPPVPGASPVPDPSLQALVQEWFCLAVNDVQAVAEQNEIDPEACATTVVASLIVGERVLTWWVGDSRAYRFRDGHLLRLTRDHGPVEEMNLPEEEALVHPLANQISRFARPGFATIPDLRVDGFQAGDVLLLMSDGVWGSLRTRDLERFLRFNLLQEQSPRRWAHGLLTYLVGNQHDNATLAVAVSGVPAALGGHPQLVRNVHLQRQQFADATMAAVLAESTKLVNFPQTARLGPHRSRTQTSSSESLCMSCGTLLTSGNRCDEHPDSEPWRGAYLEIWSPHREAPKRQPLIEPCALGRVELEGDPLVAERHLTIEPSNNETHVRICDEETDAGTWLRVRDVTLTQAWINEGIECAVGQHLVVLRHTDGARWGPAQDSPIAHPRPWPMPDRPEADHREEDSVEPSGVEEVQDESPTPVDMLAQSWSRNGQLRRLGLPWKWRK